MPSYILLPLLTCSGALEIASIAPSALRLSRSARLMPRPMVWEDHGFSVATFATGRPLIWTFNSTSRRTSTINSPKCRPPLVPSLTRIASQMFQRTTLHRLHPAPILQRNTRLSKHSTKRLLVGATRPTPWHPQPLTRTSTRPATSPVS